MIKTEFFLTRDDNVNLYKTYSDTNHLIQKVGTNEIYEEAVDVEGAGFTYIETDDLIPMPEPTQEERNTALDIMMGQAE